MCPLITNGLELQFKLILEACKTFANLRCEGGKQRQQVMPPQRLSESGLSQFGQLLASPTSPVDVARILAKPFLCVPLHLYPQKIPRSKASHAPLNATFAQPYGGGDRRGQDRPAPVHVPDRERAQGHRVPRGAPGALHAARGEPTRASASRVQPLARHGGGHPSAGRQGAQRHLPGCCRST